MSAQRLNELSWTPGCCADRKYGRGCTDATCMRLPAGKTCGDCIHLRRCEGFGVSKAANKACDFHPRCFLDREAVTQP